MDLFLARLWLILFIPLSLALMPRAGGAGASPDPGSSACEDLIPGQVYARLKNETLSHKTYTAVFFNSTERGKEHEIFVHNRVSGKYIQTPGMWCEKRLSLQASFPEQAGPGHQECYTASDDINRLLLPGAYRMLGIITMFPEDPKSSYLNGENMKRAAVWAWFDKWDRMMEGGQLKARCLERKGRPHWVLTIVRGRNPDPLYNHSEVHIWVDPELWFPIMVETYVPDDPKPVVIFDFEELHLDARLTEEDINFEGLAPRWNLVSVPEGPRLDKLAQEEPDIHDSPGLDQKRFMAMIEGALAELKDYTTEMTLELRYHRLRQYRRDGFNYIHQFKAFSSHTTHLETNYILLNSGEGFRTVYDPARDNMIHVLPAGIYRVMGEQTFPLDDPRLFSAMGDNIMDLNFFAILDELKRRLEGAEKTRVGLADYGDAKGPWIEFAIKDLRIPAYPTVMRILLDENTRLPLRLEYRGYDDPRGYLAIKFSNTRINTGLKSKDLWR
jgi:hypothetical protein